MRRLIVLAVLVGCCAATAAADKVASPPNAKGNSAGEWITLDLDAYRDSLRPVQALTPTQVFDKVKDSVFVVKVLDAKGKAVSQGSGVLLPSGKIGTNCHVLKNGVRFRVGGGKQLVSASLWGSNEKNDICILEAIGLIGKPAHLAESIGLKVGDPVYAVGAPQGLELSLSNGIVSQLRGGPIPYIQTTAAISPGSSGGGLFDAGGRLVGFTTLYIERGQSLNFAVPVEWVHDIQQAKNVAQNVGSSSAAVGLVKVGGDDTATLYADAETIRRAGNKVTMWRLVDRTAASEIVVGHPSIGIYMSSKVQDEYDCKKEQYRNLYVSWHSGNMARGEMVFSEPGSRKWHQVPPATVPPASLWLSLWKLACGKQ